MQPFFGEIFSIIMGITKLSNQKIKIYFYNTGSDHGWFYRPSSKEMTMVSHEHQHPSKVNNQFCNVQNEENKEGLCRVFSCLVIQPQSLTSFAIISLHFKMIYSCLMFPYLKKKKAYLAHSLSFSGFPRQFLKIPVIEAMCDRTLYNL